MILAGGSATFPGQVQGGGHRFDSDIPNLCGRRLPNTTNKAGGLPMITGAELIASDRTLLAASPGTHCLKRTGAEHLVGSTRRAAKSFQIQVRG